MSADSKSAPLRWGILACGKISNDFALALLHYTSQAHKVVAVATSNSVPRANEFCAKIGGELDGAKRYGSYQELLEDGEVDVVYVANWNGDHHEWAIKAMEKGKHVLCEKPLGVTVKQVNEMVACSQSTGRFLMEAFWTRYFPVSHHLNQLITSSEWGRPMVIQANFGMPIGSDRMLPGSAETPLTDIGIYPIQFVLFVFGGERPTRVRVNGGPLDANGSDRWANVTLEFPGERHALLYYSWDRRLPNNAWVVFENGGNVQIPEYMWCPTKMLKQKDPASDEPPEVVEHPLGDEKDKDRFVFFHSSGLRYEADCVHACINKGRIECGVMPHAHSVIVAEIQTEIRRQMGVVYPKWDSEQ